MRFEGHVYGNPSTLEVKIADPALVTPEIKWYWGTRGLTRIGTVTFNGGEAPTTKLEIGLDAPMSKAVANAIAAVFDRALTKVEAWWNQPRYPETEN